MTREEQGEDMWGNVQDCAGTKASGEGGGGDTPGTAIEIPLTAHGENHGETDVPLQPWRTTGMQRSTMEEIRAGGGECSREGCEPVENLCQSRFLAGTCRPTEGGPDAGIGSW